MARTPRRLAAGLLALVLSAVLGGCTSGPSRTAAPTTPATRASAAAASPAPATSASPLVPGTVPRLDHIVVVIFENHAYHQVIGTPAAPWLNRVAQHGALFTDAHAVTHPSQPNYVALFSGSTQGIPDDSCPHDLSTTANLGSQLSGAGLSFTGYAESLPSSGYRGCSSAGSYARKHAPWVDFTALPATVSQPFSQFPTDFTTLPTVSFVVPNLCHDMHDCPVATGDAWAQAQLDAYLTWAGTHNSVLIVTFDEDDNSPANQITTIVAGDRVTPGSYPEPIDHYRLLRTIESAYGLPGLGAAGTQMPVTDIWR